MSQAALADAYLHCDRIARAAATNFYWSFRVLPDDRRRGMSAVYAFARQVDDLVDEDRAGRRDDERLRDLRRLRTDLRDALAGRVDHPVLAALADTVARFSLSTKYLEMILNGAEQDLTVSRYATFSALKDYCRLVASSVGLISLEVLGCREDRARPMAENLGVAFQLTNILRDVKEDAERGRIYLPQEDLASTGCRESDILSGTKTGPFIRVCAINASRAREHYELAHPLLSHLSSVARRAVAVMASIYAKILEKIESGDYPVLERRVALSGVEKMLIFLGVLFHPTYPRSAGRPRSN